MQKNTVEQRSHDNCASDDVDISYHNKDILSKIFGENLKDKSFAAYGLNLPKIVEVLPTNLPAIEANELRMDNLFRLEDNTLVLVDYESTYSYEDKIKYLNYIVRALKRNWQYGVIEQPIRMIVIYTGNIKRDHTQPSLDVGCLQFTVEEIFLSELNASEIENRLTAKIEADIELTEEEEMQFIILPLIHDKVGEQRNCIKRCFELAKKIRDRKKQIFLLSGLLVFTDKVISKEDSEEIRRWLRMTKVGRIIQEEINQAVAEVEKEKEEAIREKEKAIKTTKKETKRKTYLNIATKMKKQGMPVKEIMKFVTGITREEIEGLK